MSVIKILCLYCKKETENKKFCGIICKIKYGQIENICKNCNKKWISKKCFGVQDFCKRICKSEYNKKNKKFYCLYCKKETENKIKNKKFCNELCYNSWLVDVKEKRKNGYIKKYGVNHPSKIPGWIEKIKKTKLERYNNDKFINIEKIKKTKLERYGNESAFLFGSVEFKNIMKKRYGNEYYNNRKKMIETMKDKKYDDYKKKRLENITVKIQNKEIGFESKKYKQYLENNNVVNVSQIQAIKENKIKKQFQNTYNEILNNLERFGNVFPLFNIENYNGNHNQYDFICKNCNNRFKSSFMNGASPRCEYCFPYSISILQQEIFDFIKSILPNNTEILKNKRILNKKEIDVFIPKMNIGFEINGLYYHNEITKPKMYHLEKTIEAEKQNIHLIHIFEDDWRYKQEIIKNRISNSLHCNTYLFSAKNCIIKEITSKEKNEFLLKYHLQGKDTSSIKFGAFYNNILVSVMTFGKMRIALGIKKENKDKNTYELYRFCSNNNIPGIASKLFSMFIKTYNPENVITYADRCWTKSTNNLYDHLGFLKISDGTPNYWYIVTDKKIHRFNFRKNVLKKKLSIYDEKLSEIENMKNNNYIRIWDCGSLKYIWGKK